MIHNEAESVKHLAAPVVEVLERLDVECPEINKYIGPRDKCPTCSGTGKVKWKWEPKVGEWFIGSDGHVYLLDKDLLWEAEQGVQNLKDCIPILHWEEIERVLEGAGWSVPLTTTTDKKWHATLYNPDVSKKELDGHENTLIIHAYGKSRQSAVMESIIKLGEELKCQKKKL